MDKIAFLGLGHMGAAMARRLLDTDHPLTVWNRTAAKTEPFTAGGATAAASPADAVRDADVVITMLADPPALFAVADEIVPALRPGARWAEMSTIGPDAVRELAGRLPEGVTLVDAPVAGSTDKAEAGELKILAGGDVSSVEPVLSRFGTVTHVGALGSGAALKVVVNVSLLGAVALVAEGLALGDALGLPEEVVRRTLESSAIGGAVPRAFAEDLHFDMALARKDAELATGTADLPVVSAIRQQYADAADRPDTAHEDIARIVPYIRERKS
ncbi:NAD(P)-dependent oxidoreductase [Streptomyces sp. TS71-3]|uniref:NAD(P)-dependent oxidoreductase n=1 Tax=Streptomyces sp. TS71-3 TaxID=2733862 RepID=UPI001B2F07C8|nr:NAD(P)-dependent oxidoreductase [Streptomyces sp. TS71-3]GHJ37880.1 dehydrogenase [Streptomyces sp. TS71-3]